MSSIFKNKRDYSERSNHSLGLTESSISLAETICCQSEMSSANDSTATTARSSLSSDRKIDNRSTPSWRHAVMLPTQFDFNDFKPPQAKSQLPSIDSHRFDQILEKGFLDLSLNPPQYVPTLHISITPTVAQ